MKLDKNHIELLRAGLEQSHWYSDIDEQTFKTLLARNAAFEDLKGRIDLWLEQIDAVRPNDEIHRQMLHVQRKTVRDVKKAMQEYERERDGDE